MARKANDSLHEDRIDIGSLLTIDLDVDVKTVHHRCRRRILERLVCHHVAPVAGGVANTQQDRNIALTRLGEGLVPPRLPIDRIVHVLTQIRRRLRGEAIGHTVIFAVRRESGGSQHWNTRLLTGVGKSLVVRHHLDGLRNCECRSEMDRVE